MKLVYATLLASSKKWRGVRMTPLISKTIDKLWKEVFGEHVKKPGLHDRCRGTYAIDLAGELRTGPSWMATTHGSLAITRCVRGAEEDG